MTLTDKEAHTAACALRIAADQYDADAHAVWNPGAGKVGEASLARQFRQQATEARALAEKLEG